MEEKMEPVPFSMGVHISAEMLGDELDLMALLARAAEREDQKAQDRITMSKEDFDKKYPPRPPEPTEYCPECGRPYDEEDDW